ncbi:MAG TPA: TetR/AcrR family transcriptional regulator [Burkholderiaceae bacterium]|jgi:AcrR family transcriptional regulator|nr:TetR/AcrR family transcriptional regulator [Burkholderiaceae bacterium]
MPKISEEHRAARRAQILDAAWRCFYRQGVQATTMEQIIAESGLSASAMYRYFGGKDDIIVAAIDTSLRGLARLLEPIVERDDADAPPGVADLVGRITAAIDGFTNRPGYNLTRIALHGWSEAQRNERLRGLMRDFYAAFRDRLAARVPRWQAAGEVDPAASPQDVAQLLMSVILGYVTQSAIVHDAEPAAHARGLAAIRMPR